jgi:hypothetical protein
MYRVKEPALIIDFTLQKKVNDITIPSRDFTSETLPGRERESLVNDIPAGDGKIADLFLQCIYGP